MSQQCVGRAAVVLILLGCSAETPPGVDAFSAGADGSSGDGGAQDIGGPDLPPPGQPLGAACDPGAGPGACAAGLLCCRPCCDGRPAVCTPPVDNEAGIGNGLCPLPDLTLSARALASAVGVGAMTVPPSSCEVRERCVDAPGLRHALHFEVTAGNLGSADLVLGSPLAAPTTVGSGFLYSRCHNHYHFADYALYQLLDGEGREVIRGKKRAFCLQDTVRVVSRFPVPSPAEPRYTCDDQGMSVGWADTYANGLTCQYIDVTGVAPGRYTLRVTVNPDRVFPEIRYDNNVAEVMVEIPALADGPTRSCVGAVEGVMRECGWTVAHTATCAPGAPVSVGCGKECGLGASRSGDPILRVCEGTESCGWPGLGANDDCTPDGVGARVNFLCPPSGRYTVMTGPLISNQQVSCEIEAR